MSATIEKILICMLVFALLLLANRFTGYPQ